MLQYPSTQLFRSWRSQLDRSSHLWSVDMEWRWSATYETNTNIQCSMKPPTDEQNVKLDRMRWGTENTSSVIKKAADSWDQKNKDDLLGLSMSQHSQSIHAAFLLTTWQFHKCYWNPRISFWLLGMKDCHAYIIKQCCKLTFWVHCLIWCNT